MYGFIGGSGFDQEDWFDVVRSEHIKTEFGNVDVTIGRIADQEFAFISRHGKTHNVPPHMVNYRGNISAMKMLGVSKIVATNAVGGIDDDLKPGKFALPDQIIDYTWGREHTFFSSFLDGMTHVDFTYPFNEALRQILAECFKQQNEPVIDRGCYGCTQGPRLETAAEIKKLQNDGCTMVGMTGMPEAALARELDIAYASVCFSVNWGAGIENQISMEDIYKHLESCTTKLKSIFPLLLN